MSGPDGATPKLALHEVSKAFGTKQVLDRLTLSVDEHEVVCLIGPSGCGKSTILRCIDLLDTIDHGSIDLDGTQIAAAGTPTGGLSQNEVRRRIGIVFQSFNLFPHMNVLDNVTLGPRRAHGVDRGEAEDRAAELLARFGLADKIREFPNRLSGGQNQRAAIVRALMVQPEVLLLDEVTSALDPELVGEVLGVIRELRDQGLTMILATHEMGFARDVANKVAFLNEGRVLESGPPAELFGDPQQERTKQFLRRVSEAGRL
ncbi:MAG: amino acid ABC transporter ATP-binding protein [Actinomycetota bacterium]